MSISEVNEKLMERFHEFSSIITGYFGEENVDIVKSREYPFPEDTSLPDQEESWDECEQYLRGTHNSLWFSVVIKFDHVVIENEHGRTHDIHGLYVKMNLNEFCSPTGKLSMLRSHYMRKELRNGYIHSHCCHMKSPEVWSICCTGRGPITYTMTSLAQQYEPGLVEVLCTQIDQYVRIESLQGVPYERMENLDKNVTSTLSYSFINTNSLASPNISKILVFLLLTEGDLRLGSNCGIISPATDPDSLAMKIAELGRKYDIDFPSVRGILINGTLYAIANGVVTNISHLKGKYVLTFKGEKVFLDILDQDSQDSPIEDNDILKLPAQALLSEVYYLLKLVLNVKISLI